MQQWTILLLGAFGILLVEWILWLLFCRKIGGLTFPREISSSRFGSFSTRSVGLIAIAHSLFLLTVLILVLILLW